MSREHVVFELASESDDCATPAKEWLDTKRGMEVVEHRRATCRADALFCAVEEDDDSARERNDARCEQPRQFKADSDLRPVVGGSSRLRSSKRNQE